MSCLDNIWLQEDCIYTDNHNNCQDLQGGHHRADSLLQQGSPYPRRGSMQARRAQDSPDLRRKKLSKKMTG